MNNIGKKKEKRVGKRAALHAHIKGHKGTFAVYLVLRLFVTFLAIWSPVAYIVFDPVLCFAKFWNTASRDFGNYRFAVYFCGGNFG